MIFDAISGLSVNWRKSNIFQVKEVAKYTDVVSILQCKIKHFPTTYLGMPLGNNHKELEIWDGIIEKTREEVG